MFDELKEVKYINEITDFGSLIMNKETHWLQVSAPKLLEYYSTI